MKQNYTSSFLIFLLSSTIFSCSSLRAESTVAPVDRFWDAALSFAQASYDIFETSGKLHVALAPAYRSVGPESWYNIAPKLRRLIGGGQWNRIQRILEKRQALLGAFGQVIRNRGLLPAEPTTEALEAATAQLAEIVAELSEMYGEGEVLPLDNTASLDELLQSLEMQIALLRGSEQLATTPLTWKEKIKNLFWGSRTSYTVVPSVFQLVIQVLGTYMMVRKNSTYRSWIAQTAGYATGMPLTKEDSARFTLTQDTAHYTQMGMGFLAPMTELYRGLQEGAYQRWLADEQEQIRREQRVRLARECLPDVSFDDVEGFSEAKAELTSTIKALSNPLRFMRFGGQVPHGILFEGPPGTGKTFLARACAGEAQVPFFYINAGELLQSGAATEKKAQQTIRTMFEDARAAGPSILFIDEFDFIGKGRDHHLEGFQRGLLATLLCCMSGFKATNPYRPVLIIAATNCAADLDHALTRPGRFDLKIHFDTPSFEMRRALLIRFLSSHRGLIDDINFDRLAELTEGLSISALYTIVFTFSLPRACSNARQVLREEDVVFGIERLKNGVLASS